MIRFLTFSLFFSFLTSASFADFVFDCQQFKNELRVQSKLWLADYDIRFTGEVVNLGASLDHPSIIELGESQIRIPFIGRENISLAGTTQTYNYSFDGNNLLAYSYQASSYDDIRSELLGYEQTEIPLFDQTVYAEWLTFKSFEVDTESLDCYGDEDQGLKTTAMLLSKGMMAEQGSRVYRLSDYDVGLLQLNSAGDRASILVLEKDTVFRLVFRTDTSTKLTLWLD